ncbi:MAG: response regulator transcription factor [Betaproteobacteria bacterium]|nr:response regulator transcription factor [Betaproteobacteria bacterium]
MTIRVLLADDHVVLREGLKVLLQQAADISVVGEAADGREAVRRAQAVKPDVVIMDIAMPGLNGIEAARLLRDKSPATRVVILSMHSNSEHVFRALEAGAAGFVLKESAGEEVAAAVHAAHAGRRYFSRAIAALESAAQCRPGRASPLDSLSARERQVLQLVVEGHSSAEIAATVHLSSNTVETYRGRLMKKLSVSNVPGLVRFAIEHGLTPSS